MTIGEDVFGMLTILMTIFNIGILVVQAVILFIVYKIFIKIKDIHLEIEKK